MKHLLGWTLLIFAFFLLSLAAPAYAHVWKTDGKITVLFHIDPNDNPVARESSKLSFEVTDTANRFNAAYCDCTVSIQEGNRTLFDSPIAVLKSNASIFNMSVPFTFPDPGAYTVTITGSPTGTSAFQNFELTYDVRAEGNPAGDASSGSGKPGYGSSLIIAGLGILVLGTLYLMYREIRSQSGAGAE